MLGMVHLQHQVDVEQHQAAPVVTTQPKSHSEGVTVSLVPGYKEEDEAPWLWRQQPGLSSHGVYRGL